MSYFKILLKCISYFIIFVAVMKSIWTWNIQSDIFKCIFLNENLRISLQILLKFVPKV